MATSISALSACSLSEDDAEEEELDKIVFVVCLLRIMIQYHNGDGIKSFKNC